MNERKAPSWVSLGNILRKESDSVTFRFVWLQQTRLQFGLNLRWVKVALTHVPIQVPVGTPVQLDFQQVLISL